MAAHSCQTTTSVEHDPHNTTTHAHPRYSRRIISQELVIEKLEVDAGSLVAAAKGEGPLMMRLQLHSTIVTHRYACNVWHGMA